MIYNKSIGYSHDPTLKNDLQRPVLFDNDLILFSVSSESLRAVSFDRISVLGGRSSSGLASPGKSFSDIIDLPSSEKDLLIRSLYSSREKAVIFPLKNKILVIYNQLLRSNGLGIALIFDYSPKCVSALIRNGIINTEITLPSPAFDEIKAKTDGAMDFSGSLSRILDNLSSSDSFSRFDPHCDTKAIIDIINCASDLTGCPISVDIGDLSGKEITLDRPTLMAFLLCLLSEARRLSKDRRATVRLSLKKFFNISVDFELSSMSDLEKSITGSDFCDKMALEMGIPFGIEISDGIFSSSFIPYRADPSVLGFKAGIFIDGKRIIRLP